MDTLRTLFVVTSMLAAGCVAGTSGPPGEARGEEPGAGESEGDPFWDDEELWAEEEATGFWEDDAGDFVDEPAIEDPAIAADVGAAPASLSRRARRAAVPRYAVHYPWHAGTDSIAQFEADLHQMRAAGIRYVRVNLTVGEGHTTAPYFDQLVEAGARADVYLLPGLMRVGTRPDGSGGALGIVSGSGDLNLWQEFVHWAAERYGRIEEAQPSACPGREHLGSFWRERCDLPARPIRVWEIWNEPNLPEFWLSSCESCPRPDARAYAEILRRARYSLRAVHRNNRVILGGLAPSTLGVAIPPARFVRQVAEVEGGRRLFDGVALHPYGNTVADAVDEVRALAEELRELRLIRGEPDDVRIWLTEIGWGVPSGEYECEPHPDGDGRCKRMYTVRNREVQEERMTQFAARMREHERDWRVGPMFWFAFRDYDTREMAHGACASQADCPSEGYTCEAVGGESLCMPEHKWWMDCGLVRTDRSERSIDRYGALARRYRWVRPPRARQ